MKYRLHLNIVFPVAAKIVFASVCLKYFLQVLLKPNRNVLAAAGFFNFVLLLTPFVYGLQNVASSETEIKHH